MSGITDPNHPDYVHRVDDIVVTARRRPQYDGGFSLSNFMAEINTSGIIQTSRHLMQFTLPRGMVDQYDPNDVKKVVLRCNATSIPGVSFAETEEIRQYGVGPGVKHPYLPIFGPIPATYIVDGAGVIHKFFYDWANLVVGFDSSQGMSAVNAYGMNPYEVGYKDDYSSEVRIYVYNQQNNQIMEVTLTDAYPNSISPVPLSWSATDEFMLLNVTWDYKDWSVKYYDMQGNPIQGINTLRSITDLANHAAGFAQRIGLPSSIVSGISKIASGAQKITDIAAVVSGGKSAILNTVKSRFGF